MKQVLAILMSVLFGVSMTAMAESAHGGGGYGGFGGGWGGYGIGYDIGVVPAVGAYDLGYPYYGGYDGCEHGGHSEHKYGHGGSRTHEHQ
jgi:hypothetical protein